MNNRIKLVIEALEDLEINSPETRFEMARIIAIQELKKQLNGDWIPVSERLPENNTKVQVTGVRYSEYTKKNIYVRFNAKYIGKHSIKVDDMWSYCECDDLQVYDEDEDEYYVKEGWYETIENWDDYTEVYVNDYKVIAWQPLPEPFREVEQ
jgi:protein-tyrosine phosphatase